ncbi:MAG: hypothetical protein JO132_10525 [Streptosporangiaceae bacterium]|nr:hypothetical protein [Streptosporangiaceae bacterium]
MKSYRYQALVKLNQGPDGDPCAKLGPQPHRMVLRGENAESGQHQVYTVLVSCDDEAPFRPGGEQRLVTLQLAGNDVADFVSVGSRFHLWLGSEVGEGVVTRRLFI